MEIPSAEASDHTPPRSIFLTMKGDAVELEGEVYSIKLISEDDERRGQEIIQKLTDQHVKEIDELLETKEKDLMSV